MSLLDKDQEAVLLNHLKTIFSKGVHTVVFIKANGDRRELTGSRDPAIIGQDNYDAFINRVNNDGTPRKVSTSALAVFEIAINDWRAFKLENLISINGVDVNNFLNGV